ncbi:MAG: hypothetical protein HUJ75_00255, partial [Parasporobacterium sp.]|nr:hypothetical protein [Parasporobacterium sp.]
WVWRTDKPATLEETGIRHQECAECGAKQNEGSVIEKLTPDHVHAFGNWKNDKKNHWKECECGEISDKAAHVEKVVKAKESTETEKGYTGDKVCSVCGYMIEQGKEIPTLEELGPNSVPLANGTGGVNLWLIIGIIVGVCAVFFLFFIIFKRRKKDEEEENQQGQA